MMADRFYREAPEEPDADPALDAMAAALEPVAVAARPDHDGQVRLSMAISLKRLADELTYSGNGGRSTDLAAPTTLKDLVDIIAETHA